MHIVMTASAKMPSSCKGVYRRVAVVQLTQEFTAKNLQPKMISERAKGVLRIRRTWEKRSVGKTEKCSYKVALQAANEMAFRLNNVRDLADANAIIGAGGSA